MTESCPKKTNIAEISPHLICALCGGYLIDATTIVECLHSFCKTCIVRYLESSKYCPICEVLVHKTRPLQNIRLDHTLQDIVYKLVPGLFQSEMKRRREFYKGHPTIRSAKVRQEQQRHRVIYSADEQFSISLEFCPNGRIRRPSGRRSRRASKQEVPERRYLRVPAGTTVALLKKFMKLKFALPPQYKVDIFHGQGPLRDHYSMMDVAYIYSWRREGVLQLYYSVYKEPEVIPEIRITEVKTELTQGFAEDTGQKADDMRPSTLFNKAALLGKNTVVKNIHDLSPLELIATVANDISIQESRGQKRKPEDAQLYENEDESSMVENRQLQKSIERAIDLCSSNQGSPGSASGSLPVNSAPSVGERRTSQTPILQSNNSGQYLHSNIHSAPLSKLKSDSPNKPNTHHNVGNKVGAKEKPKKTDTASQCDPRPKKLKGEGHSHNNHSKSTAKIQNSSKDSKSASNSSSIEKKQNTAKSDAKSSDKTVSSKANGVTTVDQNGANVNSSKIFKEPVKSSQKSVSNTNEKKDMSSGQNSTDKPKTTLESSVPATKPESTNTKSTSISSNSTTQNLSKYVSVPTKTPLSPSKSSSTPNSSKRSSTPSKISVTPASPVKTTSSQVKTSSQTLTSKTVSTPTKPSSAQATNKTSVTQVKNLAVTEKTAQSANKTSVTPSKNSDTPEKGPVTPTKAPELVKPVSQINGHVSDAELSQTQNSLSVTESDQVKNK